MAEPAKPGSMEQEPGSSDDELDQALPEFYDPDMDERDHAWVERKRKGMRKSDALLSCPACFTTLCLDCQRHESIVTQYRAMFVLNCKILEVGQRMPKSPSRKRGNSAVAGSRQPIGNSEDLQPVSCSVCDTEVAVIDTDEVYHFYNVLPSFT